MSRAHSVEARKELDRVEALPVGAGKIDLTGYLHGTRGAGATGVALGYEHRATKRLSTFGSAWGGMTWSPTGRTLDYGAIAGVRYRF